MHPLVKVRGSLFGCLVAALIVPAAVLASNAEKPDVNGEAAPVVTLIGDSVADRLEGDPEARKRLSTGVTLNLQTRGCRRLATIGCLIEGADERPPNVVQLAKKLGSRLGEVVVIAVGYNDDPATFPRDVPRVMRALVAQDVDHVVWLTLREARPIYRAANRELEAKEKQWPILTVADWDAHSAGRPSWFEADGLHLTPAGSKALAAFVQSAVKKLL